MKKRSLIGLLCTLLTFGNAALSETISVNPADFDNLLPVVVLLHEGMSRAAPTSLLLIIVHQSTGRALKATIRPDLFTIEGFDAENQASIQELLRTMEDALQIPLDKYVCVSMDTLDSLGTGEAKEKGMLELIDLGLSLLGGTQTNLSVGEAIKAFRLAFSEKDGGIEVVLPDDANVSIDTSDAVPWETLREVLFSAVEELHSASLE